MATKQVTNKEVLGNQELREGDPGLARIDFERYERVEDISQGSFNYVQRYHKRKTGVDLAVKSFPRFSRADHNWDSLFIRQIENLLHINHPCIVSLIGYSMPTKDHPARLATLFVDGCSLSSVLISSPDWWTATTKSMVIVGIVIGMRYVHSRGIIHREVKPGNILLDNERHGVHICDFGSSRLCSVDSTYILTASGEGPLMQMVSVLRCLNAPDNVTMWPLRGSNE
jgi:serine/threonine protein kinase